MTLEEFNKLGKKAKRKLTHEQKLEIVDQIIDRDVEFWKARARQYCDFGYYFHYAEGGLALTERQR